VAGRIYLLKEDSKLLAMEEAPYDSEKLLQNLLADHRDLLAGDQIDTDEPRRWLLVTREMGVPGEQDGAGRWSLDHLFLDQEAIPTVVEVKRSSDTRIRREVRDEAKSQGEPILVVEEWESPGDRAFLAVMAYR
jgi:hypothetical protein